MVLAWRERKPEDAVCAAGHRPRPQLGTGVLMSPLTVVLRRITDMVGTGSVLGGGRRCSRVAQAPERSKPGKGDLMKSRTYLL